MGFRRGMVLARVAIAVIALVSCAFRATAWAQTQATRPPEPAATYHFFAEAFAGSGLGREGLGLTVGGRAGYAVGTTLRGTISAVVSYHFGNANGVAGTAPSAGYELVPRRFYVGVELGVQPSWRMFRVRPYLTFGRLASNVDCDGATCSQVPPSVFATGTTLGFGPGLDLHATFGVVTAGVDVRWLVRADEPRATSDLLSVCAAVGVSLP